MLKQSGNDIQNKMSQPEKGNYTLMALGSFMMGCFALYHIADPVLELFHRVTGWRLGSLNPIANLFPGLFVN